MVWLNGKETQQTYWHYKTNDTQHHLLNFTDIATIFENPEDEMFVGVEFLRHKGAGRARAYMS